MTYNTKVQDFSTGLIAVDDEATLLVGTDPRRRSLNGLIISNVTAGAITFDLLIGAVTWFNNVSIPANSVYTLDMELILPEGQAVYILASAVDSLIAMANVRMLV